MATQAQRREATRGKLIEAAQRLFAAEGYEATRTQAVLEAAGVSRGALYHHFPTKQDLFAAVFEQVSRGAIERAVSRLRAGGSPREALIRGCLAWLAEARTPAVALILLEQGPQVLGWQRAREIENRFSLGHVTRAVRAAVDAGELEVESVDLTARLINASLAELALARLDPSVRVRPRVAERAVRQLIEGFASGQALRRS
jgi:AcrR family transcriptional regulator